MKHIYTVFLLVFFSLGFAQNSFGQLVISAELRPRPEFRNGYKKLRSEGDTATFLTSQRTRLNFLYKMDYMKFGIVIQDVRTWGSTPQLNNSDANMAMHEAWAEAMFNDEFSLKIGRQELVYDDHRIFGNVGWAQQARSHDVGVFKYESKFKVHVGLAFSEYKSDFIPDYRLYYKAFQYVWIHKDFDNFKASFLFLNNGLQVYDNAASKLIKQTKYSQTIGTYLEGSVSAITLNGSAYYQMGSDRFLRTLSSYDVSLNAKMSIGEYFSVKAGFELISGTDYDADVNTNNSFTPFYGTNHKFNGFMDYFYVKNHLHNVGLNDFNVGSDWNSGKWRAGATIHYFMSNGTQYDIANSEVASNGLGTEIDLSIGYKLNDWIDFSAGYSQMLATHSMELLKGGSADVANNWAYLMLTFKPTFLNTAE